MTEEEATVEADDPVGSTREGTVDAEAGTTTDGLAAEGAAYDTAAESFLELEADLEAQLPDDDLGSGQSRGIVVDADRVDADAVPDGYPVEIRTDRAIALRVDRGGDAETTVYLDWPGDDGADPALTHLLTAMDVDLSDLYGREVRLERVDGHDTLVVPTEPPRGTEAWGPSLALAHTVNAGLLTLLFATGGLPTPMYGLWVLLTIAVVPYATYKDAWYVRTHSDWDQGPLFWAALSMLPMLNPVAGLAYFWTRSRANFFGEERSLLDAAVSTVRSWL